MEFTFKQSPTLARIIADTTGDGHLQLDGKRGVLSFYSKDNNAIKNYNQRVFRLFKINGRVRTYTSGGYIRYGIFYSSKQLCRILAFAGTPVGNKTNRIFLVPKWILNGSEKVKCEYLKGMYTTEGSIYPTRRRNGIRWRI